TGWRARMPSPRARRGSPMNSVTTDNHALTARLRLVRDKRTTTPADGRVISEAMAALTATPSAQAGDGWATSELPPIGVSVIGVWASEDEFPPEVELCGIPAAGNPERQWFNAYGPCSTPDRWTHVPSGTWDRFATP